MPWLICMWIIESVLYKVQKKKKHKRKQKFVCIIYEMTYVSYGAGIA
jgi:hypothetical protein